MSLQIKTADESHAAFVFATWRESYAQFAPERFAMRDRNELFDLIRRRIEQVFAKRDGLHCLVATDTDAPGWLGGWLVAHQLPAGLCVHWAYVKHRHRREGIFSALLFEANERAGWPERLFYTQPPTKRERGIDWPKWLAANGFEHVSLSRALTGREAA